jgi:hypothetical protein
MDNPFLQRGLPSANLKVSAGIPKHGFPGAVFRATYYEPARGSAAWAAECRTSYFSIEQPGLDALVHLD